MTEPNVPGSATTRHILVVDDEPMRQNQPTCLSSLLGHSHKQLEIVEESLAFGFGATER